MTGGFTLPSRGALLRNLHASAPRAYGGFHPLLPAFPGEFGPKRVLLKAGPQHHISTPLAGGIRFALRQFRSHYSWYTSWYLFLRLLRYFNSAGDAPLAGQFGNPGFNECMPLPRAYRNLLRPSSLLEPNHPLYGIIFPRSNFVIVRTSLRTTEY